MEMGLKTVNFRPHPQKRSSYFFFAGADGSSLYYTKTSRVSRMRTIKDADTEK